MTFWIPKVREFLRDVLVASGKLIDVLGERVLTAVERLMGLILSALAIEMLLRGISGFVKTFA